MLQLPGPRPGTAEDGGNEEGVRKATETLHSKTMTALLYPSFQGAGVERGKLLYKTKLPSSAIWATDHHPPAIPS